MQVAWSYCQAGETNQLEQFKIEVCWWNVQRMLYLCKLVFKAFLSTHGCFVIFPAPSAGQLRIPIGILDLEDVGAGLETGLFRLMLHKVAQHPGNAW